MSQKFTSTVETIEPTQLKITLNIGPELFREGLTKAYQKNKHHFTVQGFRKGRAPRKMIEQLYGSDIFHEDAMNVILPDIYEAALDEHDIEPVYRPEIEQGDASEKEGAVFFATVYIRPEAEVDGYMGLTYPKSDPQATAEEIEQALAEEQTKSATQVSVDRPAQMDDTLTINFKGFIDGEPFEGGEGTNHELTLGSKHFIDTFEEQLVGHTTGDDVTVNVKFPEDYHHPDYAGKPAVFEVEIIDIQGKILPEIDDDFASNVSDFDTLAEYRADLAEQITKRKELNFENVKRGHIMRQLTDKATMEVPEAMYLARLDEMMQEFSMHIQRQGMNVETYMRFTQLTEEGLRATWRPQAETEVKNMLALEAIAKKENITVTEEEFRAFIAKITMQEGEELEKIISTLPTFRRKELMRSAICDKAMDFVIEHAVATDEPMPEILANQLTDTEEA